VRPDETPLAQRLPAFGVFCRYAMHRNLAGPVRVRKQSMFFPNCVFAAACMVAPALAMGASVQVFLTNLSGANESPPNASAGVGAAIVTFTPATSSMRVQTTFSGLSEVTTAAHIHCCTAPGTNVGVATQVPYFSGFPIGVSAGTYDHVFDMTQATSYNASFVTANGSVDAALTALLAGMSDGTAYFNIHSTTFPGGEVRGNLVLDSIFAGDFE
jgi:hypothetical protein